ncbi:MAG: hypothetical protein ABMB14_11790 [Myxococcota bacterium]
MSDTTTFKAANNRDVQVHAKLWNEATARTASKGDGRLGEADAKALFAIVNEDGAYSELEKHTLKHVRVQFRWTPGGDLAFRSLVREAASRGWNDAEVLTTTFEAGNGRKVEVDARLWAEATARTAGKGDGRLGVDDANALFALVAADGVYSELEKHTMGHIRRNFKFTEGGDEAFRGQIRSAAGKGWTPADVAAALAD